jgi:hypothetical protein
MNSFPAAAACSGYSTLVAKTRRHVFGTLLGTVRQCPPGPMPPGHGPPSREVDPGLLISVRHTGYKLKVRWYTRLDEDNCFARWLLIPAQAND